MFCPSCGKQFSDEYEICPFCGKIVNEQAPQQQPQPANYQNQQYTSPQTPQQQYTSPQNQYVPPQQQGAPRPHLECDRSFGKFLLLGFVTCGIYWIITYYKIVEDINTICRAYDGKTTQNYLVATLLLGSVTCGIYPIVWWHGFSNRIGENLKIRNIPVDFNASTFWLWNILGSFIVVGPFIFMYKLLDATNKLAADFNARG